MLGFVILYFSLRFNFRGLSVLLLLGALFFLETFLVLLLRRPIYVESRQIFLPLVGSVPLTHRVDLEAPNTAKEN